MEWELDGTVRGRVLCFFGCGFEVVDSNPLRAHGRMEDHYEVAHREELERWIARLGWDGRRPSMTCREVLGRE